MDSRLFIFMCKKAICDWFNAQTDRTDHYTLTPDDVYTIWSCKTLQNNKAVFSTTVPDGMIYELTYNGDKNELYLDAYKKWWNQKIDPETLLHGMNKEEE